MTKKLGLLILGLVMIAGALAAPARTSTADDIPPICTPTYCY